jgi:hypothetical protein
MPPNRQDFIGALYKIDATCFARSTVQVDSGKVLPLFGGTCVGGEEVLS